MVIEGEGAGARLNWVKGSDCMVTDGRQTFVGEHTAENIEIECCMK